MASGKHQAYIVEVEGQFRIRPSVATLDLGSHPLFSIRNVTDWPATVTVDGTMLVRNTPRTRHAAPGAAVTFRLDPGASGAYTYEVWVDLGSAKLPVQGESDPVIIIDP
jgi:negative regulator of sigma E activity